MEEIEVGEYVRTRDGEIGKLHKITIEPEVDIGIEIMPEVTAYWLNQHTYVEKKDIVKHSKNIIDLIEVGDILRIKVQFHHKIKPVYMLEEIKDKKTSTWKNILEQIDLCHYEIIEILTKEQMKANCYKVEE